MNAAIKPKHFDSTRELPSPTKTVGKDSSRPSSPTPLVTPLRRFSKVIAEPLTPQTSSRTNLPQSQLDMELVQSIRHLTPHVNQERAMPGSNRGSLALSDERDGMSLTPDAANMSSTPKNLQDQFVAPEGTISSGPWLSQAPNPPKVRPANHNSATRISSRSKARRAHEETQLPNDVWFGQPMRGSASLRRTRLRKESGSTFLACGSRRDEQSLSLSAPEPQLGAGIRSENTSDIRKFFGAHGKTAPGRSEVVPSSRPLPFGSSRALSVEPLTRSKHVTDQLLLHANNGTATQAERNRSSSQPSRTGSFELPVRSRNVQDAMRIHSHDSLEAYPRNMNKQFHAYENGYTPSSVHRSPSAGRERAYSPPKRSSGMKTALDLHRNERPSNNACDMAAQFKAYQDREMISPDRVASPLRRQEPRVAPPHETAARSRPQRRRTTDGAQRSKSAKLPLEHVPHGWHVQNVVVVAQTNIASIIYSSRKLDRNRNSVEWGYSPDDAYDTFVEPVTARKVMDWVIGLDDLLHECCERLPGVDTRSLLHEGLQWGLDARKDDTAMETVEVIEGPEEVVDEGMSRTGGGDPLKVQHLQNEKSKDVLEDFDMEQFVDFDTNMADGGKAQPALTTKKAEEYEDDIDDDMLMDY